MDTKKPDIDELMGDIEKKLPVVVFRNWRGWGDNIPISPRTVANMDCLDQGPKERIMVGRVCGYPRASLVEWLKAKARVVL